ncbi:MAG: 16S rRNA processing protein RimM [Ignavibacteriaceae bacterium]|nr:16S rRNA processing protein RimM [Ignavibacteriaceae bacterium]
MSEFFLIAKIISSYGKEGFVKLKSFSDFPERFFNLENVFVEFFGDKKKLFVEEVKKSNSFILMKFRNFDSEDDIKVLLKKEIYVDRKNLYLLPENFYFIHDLIGSKVIRGGEYLGVIKDVLKAPANDIYLIEQENKEELLLPAVKDFILNFDATKKLLELKAGAGIYDDED